MSELKLVAGKYYRTRDGRKAYVAAALENPLGRPASDPIVGFIGDDDFSWRENGQFLPSQLSACDLIAEWREPREWTVTVYEPLDSLGGVRFAIRDEPFLCNRILARVTVREGEGVE
jgi:hypothetical protein